MNADSTKPRGYLSERAARNTSPRYSNQSIIASCKTTPPPFLARSIYLMHHVSAEGFVFLRRKRRYWHKPSTITCVRTQKRGQGFHAIVNGSLHSKAAQTKQCIF